MNLNGQTANYFGHQGESSFHHLGARIEKTCDGVIKQLKKIKENIVQSYGWALFYF